MMTMSVSKASEVERPDSGTFGLYSKGKRTTDRRGRARWVDGGWYASVKHTNYNGHGLPATSEQREALVSMRASWGRKSSQARLAVRGMWSTRQEAEAAAFLIVARHPEWLGLLEVRRLVL